MSSKHRSELQKHGTGTGLGGTLGVTEEFQALLRNVCPSELIPSQEELNLYVVHVCVTIAASILCDYYPLVSCCKIYRLKKINLN